MDYGYRIAYTGIEPGTPVVAADGREIGKVTGVVADFEDDIFEGVNVETPDGARYVDEEQIADIYERAVVVRE